MAAKTGLIFGQNQKKQPAMPSAKDQPVNNVAVLWDVVAKDVVASVEVVEVVEVEEAWAAGAVPVVEKAARLQQKLPRNPRR